MEGHPSGRPGPQPSTAAPQVHKERQTPIFSVHQGRGQSAPGEYQDRLSLQGQGATLALAHVTPHDERIFLCRGGHPRSPGHRIQLRVYSECPSGPAGSVGGRVLAQTPSSPSQKLRRSRASRPTPWAFLWAGRSLSR